MSFPSNKTKNRALATATLALLIACGQSQTNQKQKNVHTQQSVQTNTTTATTNSTATTTGTTTGTQPHSPGATSTNEPAASIPDFTFYILKSGIRFEKGDLEKDHQHVFVLFDPSCTYCQHEARDIGKNLDKFKNTSFYFVSMNDPALMATFFSTYAKELDKQPNVHMLYDRNVHFVNRFHVPSQFPATYIYHKNGLLKNYWNGVKSAAEIVKAIVE